VDRSTRDLRPYRANRPQPSFFAVYGIEVVQCEQCGESINFKREVLREGRVLCRACAGECYYEPL